MLLQRTLHEKVDDQVDVTPMVDVVFQLMTFLLLTYHASGSDILDIPPARHGVGVEEASAVVLTMTPSETPGDPAVVYAGDGISPSARLTSPEAIRRYVEIGLAQNRRRVILQADGGVPHGEVLRIAAEVAEIEGILLHIGVQEPDAPTARPL